LKYWFAMGLLVQFCRSAEPRWLDLIRPALWHLADVDILHIPDSGPAHWAHGAYFGHSQHDERGNTNPNRNYNSPSVDLFFAIPDLFLGYCLTGERRFRDAAMEGLEGISAEAEFADFTTPYLWRERAMMMMAYLGPTGRPAARALADNCARSGGDGQPGDKRAHYPNAWGAAPPAMRRACSVHHGRVGAGPVFVFHPGICRTDDSARGRAGGLRQLRDSLRDPGIRARGARNL
jgi:hypothetical protein